MAGEAPFPWPDALRQRGYQLRPEDDADTPFLLRLYASTRAAEFAGLTGWTEEQRLIFLDQQFGAQRHHYRTHLADCRFAVIERHGHPVGRLYWQERATQIHLVDIALLPGECGQGFGTILLEALIAAAQVKGLGVGLFVEKYNPAQRLYRRLGFTTLGDNGVYWEMERAAPALDPVS